MVPVSEGAALALDEFVAATHRALSRTCAARVADSALRLAEVGQAGVGPLAAEATAHWLAQLEAANDGDALSRVLRDDDFAAGDVDSA